jgi:hypothetical protein
MDNGAYIIYSYKAPIAVCLKGRWFITKQRHSNLTTYHMQCLRYILHEEEIAVRLSNPEQFKDVLNAANAT